MDQRTVSKDVLTHGRVKIMRGKVGRMPKEISLKVGDLQVSVIVEEEKEEVDSIRNAVDGPDFRMQRRSCRRCEENDKDNCSKNLKFKNPSSGFEAGL